MQYDCGIAILIPSLLAYSHGATLGLSAGRSLIKSSGFASYTFMLSWHCTLRYMWVYVGICRVPWTLAEVFGTVLCHVLLH